MGEMRRDEAPVQTPNSSAQPLDPRRVCLVLFAVRRHWSTRDAHAVAHRLTHPLRLLQDGAVKSNDIKYLRRLFSQEAQLSQG